MIRRFGRFFLTHHDYCPGGAQIILTGGFSIGNRGGAASDGLLASNGVLFPRLRFKPNPGGFPSIKTTKWRRKEERDFFRRNKGSTTDNLANQYNNLFQPANHPGMQGRCGSTTRKHTHRHARPHAHTHTPTSLTTSYLPFRVLLLYLRFKAIRSINPDHDGRCQGSTYLEVTTSKYVVRIQGTTWTKSLQ